MNNPNVNNSPINNTNDINGELNIMGTLKSFGLMIPSVVSLVILSSTLLNANQSMAMMNMLGAVAAVCLLIISIHVMRSRQNFKSFTSKKGITAFLNKEKITW